MITREQLHQLLDTVPEENFETVKKMLEREQDVYVPLNIAGVRSPQTRPYFRNDFKPKEIDLAPGELSPSEQLVRDRR